MMTERNRFLWLFVGLIGGALVTLACRQIPQARAGNDRHEEFILATGPVLVNPTAPSDGVWLLDYKSGKLQATVIDRYKGKITDWAEVDIASEFELPPRQNVHFVMTTGIVVKQQAALYIAETTTGKFGVYTMGPRQDGQPGIAIKRQDLLNFRKAKS